MDSYERPYRSHSHPACLPCRRRKSRCHAGNATGKCLMCQAQGTDCIFPQLKPSTSRQAGRSERKAHVRSRRLPSILAYSIPPSSLVHPEEQGSANLPPSHMGGIVADATNDSSHVVSPAIVGDRDAIGAYLAPNPEENGRRLIRTSSAVNFSARPVRPVLFSTVPRRPIGRTVHSSRTAAKCEIIEKMIEPYGEELVNIFFSKINVAFPVLDAASFKSIYFTDQRKVSPAILANLYASALIYWVDSPTLRSSRCPDINFVWAQAYDVLSSELANSPGLSTVISVILNICSRPSTSILSNEGMMGLTVAFCNSFGLNRDPTGWDISPLERQIRVKLWWIVVLIDRWCSLAYGTPMLIHREQHDVPIPTVNDLSIGNPDPCQRAASAVFVSLVTLTEVLGHYLEYVYRVGKAQLGEQGQNSDSLELLLGQWEETLDVDVRRAVMRGTNMDAPGAANLRLSYLAVKLLLKRIQLDLDPGVRPESRLDSPRYLRAQRAAEDVVHFVQELNENHLRGFWLPANAFTLTSATSLLLRSALGSRGSAENIPLELARQMIATLRAHRQHFDWDLADNCLGNCSELVEKVGASAACLSPSLPSLDECMNIDASVLDDLFDDFSPLFGPIEHETSHPLEHQLGNAEE
ncbi:hypothetical protein ASPVEDRAFT_72823 [Aspergillus versicolor CBS 583.65]|uniref:Zn(2)-C6 fungal-type domain-containing protein n=1 Tax=Aspergillus versicolor CBS 583.65 TaxID=1036611 RepID=A0A1L9PNF4_ASPVE|nr:uncharacterized protein ASPVEDRAFT_72823 [Aspergillus versicolor CBS 583.65]OJJ03067.1 hypothetical protein ASPVEDRAFT_72823 [Aspergillus versicolor CBS 583.65]